MEDFEKRLIEEYAQLNKRIEKLVVFVNSEKLLELPDKERFYLLDQIQYMQGYLRSLGDRMIERQIPIPLSEG